MAREASERPEWSEFALFAELRGKGVRAQAFKALTPFVQRAVDWDFKDRLSFCRWLLNRSLNFKDRTVAIPQPLSTGLVIATVLEWSDREPDSAEAHLWLGLLGCDDASQHLQRALELDPSCDRARWTLVEWLLGDVEYNQHELPAFYIHDPRNDLPVLDQVDALIDARPDHREAVRLRQEVAELRRLATEWLTAHPKEGDFASY